MTQPPGDLPRLPEDPAWSRGPHGGRFGYAGYPQQQPHGHLAPPPRRPGTVVAAAVLGFVFGAFGLVVALGALVLGAIAGSLDDDSSPAGFDGLADAAVAVAVVVALLAIAWAVLLIWGGVWALTGRSRVLLLVGGSIALVVTTLGFLGSVNSTSGGDVVVNLLLFAGALAIVLLLSLRPSADFFAASRGRRGS